MEVEREKTDFGNGTSDVVPPSDERLSTRPHAQQAYWFTVGTLWRHRKLIFGVTGIAIILSVVIALLTPKWYAAEARVLTPEGGSGGMLGMLQSVAPGAAALFGGGGEYPRYLSILTSRSMLEAVVDEFDLVQVYEIDDSDTPVYDAIEILDSNVEFEVSMDYNYLAVRALDTDPARAAAMANFMIEELNETNARLASQNARQTRTFIERRLHQAEADLDSVRTTMQTFQEQNGVVELESQAQAFMQSVAELKGEVAQLEVRYQTLAQQYGPDNPQVRAARDAMNAARAQVSGALGGRDALLPVSMQELPALGRRYAELTQDMLIQTQIIETIYPLYEQALFQERNETQALQVVDEAVPPVLAAKPSRRLIVIAATLSAFMLACLFVLLRAWLRGNYALLARRLDEAAVQAGTGVRPSA